MSEIPLVLSFVLGTVVLLAIGGLALFSVAHAKDRIILEQRRALESEQRLQRAQNAFADNAHHELKTPLQIISGNLYLLGALNPSPDQRKVLSQTEAATRRLQDLVQDLLDFTALQHGGLVVRRDLVDLAPHLQALAVDHEARARAMGLDFHTELEALPAPVFCDWIQLRRALAALLDNALRFTVVGSIQVRSKVHREGGESRLRFEVVDTGQGLPRDWPRLMLPFEQEAPRAHRVQAGLGIGLPLAAGIIERLGGTLGLEPLATGTLAWPGWRSRWRRT